MAAESGGGGGPAFYAMAGVQLMSTLVQADAVKKQAQIQADIDAFNAELAEYDAWRIEGAGQAQIARYQTQLDQAAGSAKVAAAAVGADTKSGSLAEITGENQLTGFLNKLDMDNRIHEQAMGYKRQARNIRLQGDMRQIGAGLQANSLLVGGVAQGLGTAASGYMADKKLQTKTPSQQKQSITPTGYSPLTADKVNNMSNYSLLDDSDRPKFLMP